MPLDGCNVSVLVRDLRTRFWGSPEPLSTYAQTPVRIEKIYQPNPSEVLLQLKSAAGSHSLILCVNPQSPAFYLSSLKKDKTQDAGGFCMLMRKYFEGAKLCAIRQLRMDRLVVFDFEKINDLGDLVERHMVLELIGKKANLILIREDNLILDCLKRSAPADTASRAMLPGHAYVLPPHFDKEDPAIYLEAGDAARFYRSLRDENGTELTLSQVFNGLSPQSAREIEYRAECMPNPENALWLAFCDFFNELASSPAPRLYLRDSVPVDFTAVPYRSVSLESIPYDNIHVLIEEFNEKKLSAAHLSQQAKNTKELIKSTRQKLLRKKAQQESDLEASADRETDKHKAELLTSNLYRKDLPERASEVRLTDYYQDPPEECVIKLDEKYTLRENATRLFALYNKKKRAEEIILERLDITEKQLSKLAELELGASLCDCEADWANLKLELIQAGFWGNSRRASDKKGPKAGKPSEPLQFTSEEGFTILVGKNNVQNDFLTFKKAFPTDLWLHVKDYHGSHVILRLPEGLSEDYPLAESPSLLQAAELAAYYSEARDNSKVQVDYTYVRYVKKPSGSAYGFVNYTHQTSVFVEPKSIQA